MNYKRFKKYIVVGENWRPMAFARIGKIGGQFCYCDTEKCRRPHAVEVYSFKTAKALIKKTRDFRRENGFEEYDGKYILMPVK